MQLKKIMQLPFVFYYVSKYFFKSTNQCFDQKSPSQTYQDLLGFQLLAIPNLNGFFCLVCYKFYCTNQAANKVTEMIRPSSRNQQNQTVHHKANGEIKIKQKIFARCATVCFSSRSTSTATKRSFVTAPFITAEFNNNDHHLKGNSGILGPQSIVAKMSISISYFHCDWQGSGHIISIST